MAVLKSAQYNLQKQIIVFFFLFRVNKYYIICYIVWANFITNCKLLGRNRRNNQIHFSKAKWKSLENPFLRDKSKTISLN
jgi:hypothetical protein